MDIERGLIACVVQDHSIEPVLDARITLDFFEDDQYSAVWAWILDHWSRYGRTPSLGILRKNFPSYRVGEPQEPLKFYIDELQRRRKHNITREGVLLATDALQDDDVDEALAALSRATQDAYTQVSGFRNIDLAATMEDRVALYDDWAANPGLRGFGTGFSAIDKATRGVQREQFIVIAGAQKAGKSTILMAMGIVMHEKHKARVQMFSFEMSAEEQAARHDSMRAMINHSRLLDGRMTKKDRRKLLESAEKIRKSASFTLCTDIAAVTTVSGIRAQIEQEKPDVAMIDGVYLMQDERGEPSGSPQALTNISRDLKRMTQATGIPIIVTTQALEHKMTKSGGITAGSVGYTSAFGQDCNVMLGVQPMEEPGVSEIRVLLSRSGPLATSRVMIDWAEGKIEELEWDDDDDDSEGSDASSF